VEYAGGGNSRLIKGHWVQISMATERYKYLEVSFCSSSSVQYSALCSDQCHLTLQDIVSYHLALVLFPFFQNITRFTLG